MKLTIMPLNGTKQEYEEDALCVFPGHARRLQKIMDETGVSLSSAVLFQLQDLATLINEQQWTVMDMADDFVKKWKGLDIIEDGSSGALVREFVQKWEKRCDPAEPSPKQKRAVRCC